MLPKLAQPSWSNTPDWHQQLILDILHQPLVKSRVGGAYTSVGHLLKFNITDNGFPATMAKKLAFQQVARELYCFLKGYTHKTQLHAHGVHIWDGDMAKNNVDDIGPIYGYQWRKHDGWFDQLNWAVQQLIQTNGASRRAIVSAWAPLDIIHGKQMTVFGPLWKPVLPPCHVLFQFNMVGSQLYTDVYQRSADLFLGLPFDVASYAILTRLVRNMLETAGIPVSSEHLNYHISNLHLYEAHEQAAKLELLEQAQMNKVELVCDQTIDTFHYENCRLENYFVKTSIKAPLLT